MFLGALTACPWQTLLLQFLGGCRRLKRLCPGRFGLASRPNPLTEGVKHRDRSAVLAPSSRVLGPCAAAGALLGTYLWGTYILSH